MLKNRLSFIPISLLFRAVATSARLRGLLMLSVVLFGSLLSARVSYGQTADSTVASALDSVCGGELRPRQGTYIIETYPSPAHSGETVTVQYYNHTAQEISLRIVDAIDRTMIELQDRQPTAPGLHTFKFPSQLLASGAYFVRLTVYAGSERRRLDSRFLIIH